MSRHFALPFVLMVLLVLMLGLGLTPPRVAAGLAPASAVPYTVESYYFEVNSTSDDNMAHDKNQGDCICASSLDECTLRAAIEEANACVGADTIAFHSSLQGTTIYLDSGEGALPSLYEQASISAQSIWDSANDRPGLVLHGGNAINIGLALSADSCGVYGLYITAFSSVGVYVNTAYNYVGGPYVGQRNILSGNGNGIEISSSGAHHNNVQGNWIGLNITGDGANPNADGIRIGSEAHDNTIGGSNASEGNVISGNTQRGVAVIHAGSNGNRLGGNLIGLAADGFTPLANGWQGVYIGDDTQNTTIGSPLAGNTIASNGKEGIYVQYASLVTIQGNTVNGNGAHGIYINGGQNNQVLANTIAYNSSHGVLVQGTAATGNLIIANSIHHNGSKGIDLANGGNGELSAPTITSATSDRVEGTACANCMVHVYSDSAEEGEVYHGAVNADASGNWVYTGTLVSGPNATATNTDSGNNTSEFSAPVVVGPPCTPVSGVTITGPATGVVYVPVCFTATVTPANASPPIDYLWAPGPGSGQGTPVACYTWGTSGDKVITVTASNCGGTGTAQATHTITIGGGSCVPVTGVTINGPTSGLVGVTYGFNAVVAPANATEPIAYTWTPAPSGGQGTSNASYAWSTPGTYPISVAVSNCGGTGTGSDDHTITISAGTVYRVFLPIVEKHP